MYRLLNRARTRLFALAATGALVLTGAATAEPLNGAATEPVAGATATPPRLPPNPAPDEVVAQNPRLSHLGAPVTTKIITNMVMGEEDGRQVVYGVYRGAGETDSPAAFVVSDALTGELVRSLHLPGASHATEVRAATDGKVYFGTTYDYNFWVYDPVTKDVTNLGPLNEETPTDGYVWSLAAAEDGKMYVGTYPKGHLYLYDPADGTVTNLGQVDPSQSYIRAMAYDLERQNLYVGVGGSRAQIYKVSSDGTTTALITDENAPGLQDESFVFSFTFTGDRLFARGGSSQLLVIGADDQVEYWTDSGKEMFGYHVSERPDAPGRYVFTYGSTFWEYDAATGTKRDLGIPNNGYLNDAYWTDLGDPDWPGPTMVAATSEGVARINLTTGESVAHEIEFSNPVAIQKILTGPDSMYASGYMEGLTPFDSVTGDAGATLKSGQYESSAVRDGKMLLGAYGNGRVLEYDPAAGTAPRQLFDLKAEDQDRPFAMDYDEENDRLFVGTVPYYGNNQGALAVYDFATRKKSVYTAEVVADQSVISVLHHDGLLYVGTTLDGGLGAPPSGQTEAHFVVFDPDTGQKVHDFVPVAGDEGVTGLMVGPDGLIWGVSEDTVFKYDPAQQKIVFSKKLLVNRYGTSTVWAWAYLVTGADGNVYGTNRGSLFRIDAETMEYTRLVNGVGNYANVDANGDILFSSGINIFRYDVPGPVVCDQEITGTQTGPLAVTEGTTCVTDATVVGPVTVGAAAGLVLTGSEVTGPVRAHTAATVTITGSTISGPTHVTGTTGTLTVTGNDITGPVELTGNTTTAPPVVGGNTITGPLACSGNDPAPVSDGDANTVTGPRTGQCADL
ncbi:PQQ-binding-like beta-propeller repeat protein [Jiangella sp. DSM 45060]|uniref:PQQ-binding-like beta-propeller repeat protein n=1 Tax=Jiangella sp. DSM 45060 TaxID=1798224 RepID=UPI00087BF0FE|nr:PQQ-binding-like beta-propeller repeat protein [Jiangella sp. DSM 45060]SDS51528.1 hypothetical protein SAMN04515669_1268 [Jiangella sp. DSM 45060]